ncbi:MAG: ATP-binding protein [Clostridia bacterium]|nr:ATP-binding protein [Clostridia bacterium]
MAKVIMTCGRICCGKTTYAQKLREERNAVILSIDELMLTLFPEGAGEMHDTYALRTEQYLLSLSLQILRTGTDVILDWGLWTKAQRDKIRAFYTENGFESEIHYLQVSREEWERRIRKRNGTQKMEKPSAYFVDEGLLRKVESLFEEPSESEVDLIVRS